MEKVVQDCGSCGEPGRPAGCTPLEELLLFPVVPLLLIIVLFPTLLLGGGAAIIVEIAAAKAAVKFGSEAMAAVTVSIIEAGVRCPNCAIAAGKADSLLGENIGCPKSCC